VECGLYSGTGFSVLPFLIRLGWRGRCPERAEEDCIKTPLVEGYRL